MPTRRFEVRRTADIPGNDRPAGSDQRGAPTDIISLDVSAAGHYIYVVVLGNVQFNRDPQAAARLVAEGLPAEVDPFRSFPSADRKIMEEALRIFFGGIHFEANLVVDLSGISGIDHHVPQVENNFQPLPIMRLDDAVGL